MDIRPVFLALCLVAAAPAMSQVYKWVDKDGVTHYSDRPREGAEIVELGDSTRPTGARIYRSTAASSEPPPPPPVEEPVQYDRLVISSPAAEQTLWNIEGVLSVSLALSPGLQNGHQVRVYFDGAPRMVSGTSFQLEEVWRGVHNLQAEVIDETGKLLIRSPAVRFYVQQTSVNRLPRG
jgi:hypothetical protein